MEWLIFLIQNNRLRSFAVEPPCATFSPAPHPCIRSYRQPRGFCQQDPKTWVGNRLPLQLFAFCSLHRVPAPSAWVNSQGEAKSPGFRSGFISCHWPTSVRLSQPLVLLVPPFKRNSGSSPATCCLRVFAAHAAGITIISRSRDPL